MIIKICTLVITAIISVLGYMGGQKKRIIGLCIIGTGLGIWDIMAENSNAISQSGKIDSLTTEIRRQSHIKVTQDSLINLSLKAFDLKLDTKNSKVIKSNFTTSFNAPVSEVNIGPH
jgi:hypothetical protein